MRAREFIPERVNAEVIDPGYTVRRQLPNGMIIQARAMEPFTNDPDPYMRDLRGVEIRVFDPQDQHWMAQKYGVAEVRMLARQDRSSGEWNLRPTMLHVNEKYRRQGIASAMYNFVRSLGNDIVPGLAQTAQGEAFWQKGSAGLGRDAGTQELPPPPKPVEPKTQPAKEPSFRDRWRRLLFPQKEPA